MAVSKDTYLLAEAEQGFGARFGRRIQDRRIYDCYVVLRYIAEKRLPAQLATWIRFRPAHLEIGYFPTAASMDQSGMDDFLRRVEEVSKQVDSLVSSHPESETSSLSVVEAALPRAASATSLSTPAHATPAVVFDAREERCKWWKRASAMASYRTQSGVGDQEGLVPPAGGKAANRNVMNYSKWDVWLGAPDDPASADEAEVSMHAAFSITIILAEDMCVVGSPELSVGSACRSSHYAIDS